MYVGVDMTKVERWQQIVDEHPQRLERIFTDKEIVHCEKKGKKKAESYAGLWAAREAVSKALRTGFSGASWKDAHVTWGEWGEPILHLGGMFLERAQAMGIREWSISISHEGSMAVAVVIMR